MDWSFESASLGLPCAISAAALSSSEYSDCDSDVLAAGAPELQTRYRARTVATRDGRAGMYRSCKKGSWKDRDLAGPPCSGANITGFQKLNLASNCPLRGASSVLSMKPNEGLGTPVSGRFQMCRLNAFSK